MTLKDIKGQFKTFFTSGTHHKRSFYIVNFFLLFFKSQKKLTFGFYNLTDVTLEFHSFKSKVGQTFMNSPPNE